MGMLAKRWNKATKKVKAKYQKMADDDKQRYQNLKEEAAAAAKPKRANNVSCNPQSAEA